MICTSNESQKSNYFYVCRRVCFSQDFRGLRPRSPTPRRSSYIEQPLQRPGSEGSDAIRVKQTDVIDEPYDER